MFTEVLHLEQLLDAWAIMALLSVRLLGMLPDKKTCRSRLGDSIRKDYMNAYHPHRLLCSNVMMRT